MKAETTPGPWMTWRDPIEGIWRVDHKMPDNSIIVGFIGKEPNARLIAAAPDLLVGAEKVVSCMDPRYVAGVDELIAAIKKARGE